MKRHYWFWISCASCAVAIAAAVGCDGKDMSGGSSSISAPSTAKGDPSDNRCLSCHLDYRREELYVQHKGAKIGCVKCHGPSAAHSADKDVVNPPDKMYAKAAINAMCIECHAVAKLPSQCEPSSPQSCVKCHGKHKTKMPRTINWKK